MQKKSFYRPTYPIFFRTVTGNKEFIFLGLVGCILNEFEYILGFRCHCQLVEYPTMP